MENDQVPVNWGRVPRHQLYLANWLVGVDLVPGLILRWLPGYWFRHHPSDTCHLMPL